MARRFRSGLSNIYQVPRPPFRRLRIFSVDPSLATRSDTVSIKETVVEIPWESHPDDSDDYTSNNTRRDGPAPGPVGEYIEVIDYDPASKPFYQPVDLNDPYLLSENGLGNAPIFNGENGGITLPAQLRNWRARLFLPQDRHDLAVAVA